MHRIETIVNISHDDFWCQLKLPMYQKSRTYKPYQRNIYHTWPVQILYHVNEYRHGNNVSYLWFNSGVLAVFVEHLRISRTIFLYTWWRQQMDTFSALLALCAGIHRSPVNSPHKGQWRRALMFSLICARINGWVNNCEAGDFRRHRTHYDVTVMYIKYKQNFLSPHLQKPPLIIYRTHHLII